MSDVRITVSVELPCGHSMTHSFVQKDVDVTHVANAVTYLCDAGAHWAKNRTARHDCELVSETNKYGLRAQV